MKYLVILMSILVFSCKEKVESIESFDNRLNVAAHWRDPQIDSLNRKIDTINGKEGALFIRNGNKEPADWKSESDISKWFDFCHAKFNLHHKIMDYLNEERDSVWKVK